METGIIPNVKKIAVLRALVLGDLIFALPALEALTNAYPEAEIVYLGHEWHKSYLPGRVPGIDRVETFSRSKVDYEDLGFLIDPREAEGFFARMRAEHFDLAIQLQVSGTNANPFIQRMHPRVSIGSRELGKREAVPLDRWIPYEYYQNEVARLLEVVGLAGAKASAPFPRLKVLDLDLEAARRSLGRIGGPFVVLHTGARDIRRCWTKPKFAQVADELKRSGLEVVLTGLSIDEERTEAIEGLMEETPINLVGKLSLPALTGLLSQARLVISNDTGVLHLALAIGTKAVGLFWVEYISKSLPLSSQNFVPLIGWDRRCPLCGAFLDKFETVRVDPDRPCEHMASFIDTITVEEVLTAAKRLLEEFPSDTSRRAGEKALSADFADNTDI